MERLYKLAYLELSKNTNEVRLFHEERPKTKHDYRSFVCYGIFLVIARRNLCKLLPLHIFLE